MKLGRCVKKKNTELNDLQIIFNLYSIEYTRKTRYLMFKLINFVVFLQIFTDFEFDGTGATKDRES
jgi:hypothetical protein